MKDNIKTFFEDFINKQSLFKDKKTLQSVFMPKEIIHRDEQINKIAQIIAPVLRNEKPSNLFIYGKTGTGKTLSVKYLLNNINEIAKSKNISLKSIYINCKLKKVADTEYRLVAELVRFFGKAVPPTGLPTDEVYNKFFSALDEKKQNILLVLDELDQLIKKTGDEFIYNLTRINSDLKNSQLTLIGISNNLMFADNLDPRVKSSLSEEEIIFPPYNALQIQNILKERAKLSFRKGVLDEGVISKCAAYAAREHGDARRALELLRVAGEIAERNNMEKITITELDEAEKKIERDKMIDIITTQPNQFQVVLYSILLNDESSKKRNYSISTGGLYSVYKELCSNINLRPLTQRRVSDIISELDMFGLINASVKNKGHYGRTREITVSIPEPVIPKIKNILKEDLGL
jgi:cell division control protein 6